MSRCTILGPATLHRADVSECILHGLAVVDDVQHGCLRFSAWTDGSVLPRKYESVRIPPATGLFTSTDFGQPGYAQLLARADAAILPDPRPPGAPPPTISAGAADGSEMGAFAREKTPIKLAALTTKFQEYMPAGLALVVIPVTSTSRSAKDKAMPSDRSRPPDPSSDAYTGVAMQQGRVLLDRDFNAERDILDYRDRVTARDEIGRCGTPDNGFGISAMPRFIVRAANAIGNLPLNFSPPINFSPPASDYNLRIGAGTIHVGGLRVELPCPFGRDESRIHLFRPARLARSRSAVGAEDGNRLAAARRTGDQRDRGPGSPRGCAWRPRHHAAASAVAHRTARRGRGLELPLGVASA